MTRSGYFEIVGTMLEHQRKGLAEAVIFKALHRLKRMGAVVATVTGISISGTALYSAVISRDFDLLVESWIESG